MIEAAEIVSSLWLTICLLVVLVRLHRGHRSVIHFVFLVFYVLFVLPLPLDLTFGIPGYSQEPGFLYASRDPVVRVLYCAFVDVIPLIWLSFLKRKKVPVAQTARALAAVRRLRPILFAVLLCPIGVVIFAPNPLLYLNYAFIVTDQFNSATSAFHSLIMSAAFFSTLAGAGIIAGAKRVWAAFIVVLPFLGISAWLNGKRTIVAVTVAMILAALWLTGRLFRRTLVIAFVVAALVVSAFSYFYQSYTRRIGVANALSTDLYENARIDYTRDSRVKMALFAELYPSASPILEFRGESALFNLTAWIPRSLWSDKPYPYAVYFTSAMFGSSPVDRGWGMTTSVLDEAIANFGWFGLALGPILVGLLCRIGDSTNDLFIALLTAIVVSLLLAVELVAFAPLFVLWLALIVRKKVRIS
jgi:oligosaccharide repeat unit polymerase